jgi:HEAT repeat protein
LKAGKKKSENGKRRELEARRSHCAVASFLRAEPNQSAALNCVTHLRHKTILEKLIWSDAPVLSDVIAKNLGINASAVWYAIGNLNESLTDFSRHESVLKNQGVTIQIPRGDKGGHKFGYYFVCIDGDGRRLTEEEIKTCLTVSPVAQEGHGVIDSHPLSPSLTQGESGESGSCAEPSLTDELASEADAVTLRKEVLRYLRDLANECAELPYYFPQHLRGGNLGKTPFDKIRQVVRVIEDRAGFHKRLAEDRERLRRQGIDQDYLRYMPNMGMLEEEGDYGYGQTSGETIPWDERASKRFPIATIFGDPGFGKSWLLRHEARRLASDAIDRLTSGAITDIRDVYLPVWIRLPDLARRKGTFEGSIARVARRKHSKDFRDYVHRQLCSGHAIVLLDAWDEVSDISLRRKLGERIRNRQYSGQILLTSRIVGYDMTQPPLPDGKEVELAPWNWRQIESYVRVWFGDNEPRVRPFLSKLEDHLQFRGLARIPLMLMLLCQACPEGDLPSRRSNLYERCLYGLFRDWHIRDKEHLGKYTETQLSETYIRGLIEVLGHVALELLTKPQNSRTLQFTEQDIDTIIEPYLNGIRRDRRSHVFKEEHVHSGVIIKRAKDDGVLIKATSEDEHGPLSFLHLTFQEYLAATALARRSDCVEEAVKRIYEPVWNQVLIMLGGLMRRPRPYIAALLRKNREDLFCRPLLLAMQTAVEVDDKELPERVVTQIIDEVLNICLSETEGPLSETAIRGITYLPMSLKIAVSLLRGNKVAGRMTAIRLLKACGGDQVIPALMEALNDENDGVFSSAAKALAEIGSEDAMAALHRRLTRKSVWAHRSTHKCRHKCSAKCDPVRMPVWLRMLVMTNKLAHALAAEARAMDPEDRTAALIEKLGDENEHGRAYIAEALGTVGSKDAITALIRAKEDKSEEVRLFASGALALLGFEDEVPTVLTAMQHEAVYVRAWAADVLGRLDWKNGVADLMKAMEDENRNVRASAVRALGRIGSGGVISTLIGAMRDEHADVRESAAEALHMLCVRLTLPASPDGGPPKMQRLLRSLATSLDRLADFCESS